MTNLPEQTDKPAFKVASSDQSLAEQAYNDLSDIFEEYAHLAILEAGRYLIQEFYGNDYEKARSNEPVKNDAFKSLNQMILSKKRENPRAFSKSWIYNAVKFACDEQRYARFQTYGKLSQSHKIELFRIDTDEEIEQLSMEVCKHNYSVRQLRARISELKNDPVKVSIEKLPSESALKKMAVKDLQKLQKQGAQKIKKLMDTIKEFEHSIHLIESALAEKGGGEKKERDGM